MGTVSNKAVPRCNLLLAKGCSFEDSQYFQKHDIGCTRAGEGCAAGGAFMESKFIVGAVAAALLLQGCSSRPREFTPTLAPAGAAPSASHDQLKFKATYAECQQLYVAGKLDAHGRTPSALAGAAAGATTAAVGTAGAVATAGYAGMAVLAGTVVLLPFAVLGGAWGMSKAKRAKKERAIKAALEGCLQQRGYQVAGWTMTGKKPVKATGGKAAD
jgi:hypothetical protein